MDHRPPHRDSLDARDRSIERFLRFLGRSPVVPIPWGGEHLLQPVHMATWRSSSSPSSKTRRRTRPLTSPVPMP
jgi:hypothetical protein